jgi:hypothetical protein
MKWMSLQLVEGRQVQVVEALGPLEQDLQLE